MTCKVLLFRFKTDFHSLRPVWLVDTVLLAAADRTFDWETFPFKFRLCKELFCTVDWLALMSIARCCCSLLPLAPVRARKWYDSSVTMDPQYRVRKYVGLYPREAEAESYFSFL